MSGNPQTAPDRTGAVVTIGMLVLSILGVATVFHESITALLMPEAPDVAATVEEPTAQR